MRMGGDAVDKEYGVLEKELRQLIGDLYELRRNLPCGEVNYSNDDQTCFDEMQLEEIWETVAGQDKGVQKSVETVLEKWHSKTLYASGVTATTLTLNRSVVAQVNDMMASATKVKLISRSQVREVAEFPLGTARPSFSSAKEGREVVVDSEVFDDSDYYNLLINDLVKIQGTRPRADDGMLTPLAHCVLNLQIPLPCLRNICEFDD